MSSGALGGAGSGAAAGTAIMPGWGTAIGAGLGALGGYAGSKNSPQYAQGGGNTFSGTQINPALLPLYGWLSGNAQQMMQQPTPFFPGQTYVGPSDTTKQGVNWLKQGAAAQRAMLPTAMGNYNFLSNAADVANNPYVQNMLKTQAGQMNQQLTEQWLPATQRGFAQVSGLGSDRQGLAEAQAIERTAKGLGDAQNQLMLGAYGQGLGAQQYALGQTGALQNAMEAPGRTLGTAGQIIEDYQSRALQDAMARYMHPYTEPWQRMQNVAGLLPGLGGMNQNYGNTSTWGQNPQYMSPWQAALGGGMAGAGMFRNLFARPGGQGTNFSGPMVQQPGGYNIILPGM